jgi:iron complex outermembrane recepter protein
MNNLVQRLMFGCSATAMLSLLVPSAQAQQQVQPTDVETVVVSGSRISIGGFEAPTPVTVVDTEKLESNAYANIFDSVRQLPQLNSAPASFGMSQGAAAPANAGANLPNLRNLGVNRTLTLFDGQRVANSNLTGGVDITVLPSTVISRVDVVTGGASAAWGSDAVAGVVNFVIDKDFVGFKGSVQGGETTSGLVRSISAQAMWGDYFFGDRAHLEVAASYNKRPDTVLLIEQKWYRGAYLVSNPAFTPATASNANPQFVVANRVGLANSSMGGLIQSSPAGTGTVGVNGVTALAPANALRGIRFTGGGAVEQVNFGNVTAGVLSNGGSLTERESEAPWQTIGGPNTTYTMFAHGSYKLTDTIKASTQLNYGYFTGKGDAQSFHQLSLVIRQDNAFLPDTVRNAMIAGGIPSFTMGTINGNNFNNYTVTGENYTRQAAGALAPATTYNRRQFVRGVFTLEGTLGEDWFWNTYYQYSQTRNWVRTNGVPIIANLTAAQDAVVVTQANRGNSGFALGSIVCRSSLPGQPAVTVGKVTAQPGCVPVNSIGEGVASAAGIRYATGNNRDFENMTLTMNTFEASMQGKLPWSLPAGDINVAFGFHYREETGKNVADTIGDNGGYAVGNYVNFPYSSVKVKEGFLEVEVPILKDMVVQSLDFNAAGRVTDYSTSGVVETWKLGFISQLNEDIKLRATWSVDIRAPTIQDLFAPNNIQTNPCVDPKTGLTQTCISNVFGNSTLAPETARTITGGVVLTPHWVPGLSFSLDWYAINLTGQIATVSANQILNTCRVNINDPLCSALVFGGANGALSAINRVPINFNSLRTSGMDIQASYATALWNDDSLTLSFNANYVDQFTLDTPGASVNNYAGVLGAGGASNATGSPKWKGLLSGNYKIGPYSFTTQVRWFGSAILNNAWNTGNLATAATRYTVSDSVFNVDPTAYLDLRASYQLNDAIQFYAAMDNALNIPPQLVPAWSGAIQSNSGPIHSVTQYDYLGREVRLGIRFNF